MRRSLTFYDFIGLTGLRFLIPLSVFQLDRLTFQISNLLTMTILDEPSDSQDERSPLKKDVEINTTTSSAALATAPPPYTSIASIPTPSPNPIPSSQAIPQTDPHSPHVILLRRRSPIRRFLVAFLVAWLVLFLWSALVHSFNKAGHFLPIGRRHSYEYEVVRLLPSLCP